MNRLMRSAVDRFCGQFYDRNKINWNGLLFTSRQLWQLLVPLMIEQLLTAFMGTADTMMVSRVGSAAISAVSLVDSINVFVIQIFTALATGGTIICSQYLGRGDVKRANAAARQVLLSATVLSAAVAALCMVFRMPLLSLVFGHVSREVMEGSGIYFFYTALSFPFITMFECGAAFYRAGGNSRFPMIISVIANVMNIVGNAILIFGFGWGVAGAAISTLLSRVFSVIVIFFFLRKPRQEIVIDHYFSIRPDFRMIWKVLTIGVPAGIENGMFQFGKLAIQSSVSLLGTAAIAAQAMTALLENLNGIAGIGIGIGLMTVVGQSIGAGRREEAKYYILKLCGYAEIVLIIGCAVIYLLTRPVIFLAGMEPAAGEMCLRMMTYITFLKPVIWVFSFIPAYGMRAAGDVKFSMMTTSITMWCLRVALCTILIRIFHFGIGAVWIGMFSDWILRSIIFFFRYRSGKWLQHYII